MAPVGWNEWRSPGEMAREGLGAESGKKILRSGFFCGHSLSVAGLRCLPISVMSPISTSTGVCDPEVFFLPNGGTDR